MKQMLEGGIDKLRPPEVSATSSPATGGVEWEGRRAQQDPPSVFLQLAIRFLLFGAAGRTRLPSSFADQHQVQFPLDDRRTAAGRAR